MIRVTSFESYHGLNVIYSLGSFLKLSFLFLFHSYTFDLLRIGICASFFFHFSFVLGYPQSYTCGLEVNGLTQIFFFLISFFFQFCSWTLGCLIIKLHTSIWFCFWHLYSNITTGTQMSSGLFLFLLFYIVFFCQFIYYYFIFYLYYLN
jgi:hypothetical protein